MQIHGVGAQPSVSIVPGSGAEELVDLRGSGTMTYGPQGYELALEISLP